VDREGFVYVAGRAGPGFPVTPGAFQTQYAGSASNRFYGEQNGFVAKLSPDGGRLVWASYVGVGELCRDLALDGEGDLYVPLGWNSGSARATPPRWFAAAFARAFQKTPAGGIDCGVVRIRGDGTAAVWATWLGGADKDSQEASIRVGADRQVSIAFNTRSPDLPTTAGAAARRHHGEVDGYVARLKADGSGLVFATYLGGSGTDWAVSTHNLAIDRHGHTYVALATASPDFPTTAGAHDRTRDGPLDIALVKLGPAGQLIHSTLIGGSAGENADGIDVDATGQVFFAGVTSSPDFPVTADARQATFGGERDAVVVRVSPDFRRLTYATFMGGRGYDNARSACLGADGSLYLAGAADGEGWPVHHAFQATFAGGGGKFGNGDCLLARFAPGAKTVSDTVSTGP
jgi:hypothetical protein